MSTPVAAPRLLRGLFDDASLFPPAALAMPAAVVGHVRHRAAWYRGMTGPFVCPAARLTDLGVALTAGRVAEIDLSLIVTGSPAALAAAVQAVADDPRLRLRAVEVALPPDAEPAEATAAVIAALDDTLLAGAVGYIELPVSALADSASADLLLGPLARHGYRPKLRTGGVTAAAFPDERTLAAALLAVACRRLPFKCTAGLHHAVRHTTADTGFEQHGFLNVLLAVAAADGGADLDEITAMLAERDPARLIAGARGLDEDQVMDVREVFTSFGTCSTDEPVADLVALGLAVPAEPAEPAGAAPEGSDA
jgi:hypothetical protein